MAVLRRNLVPLDGARAVDRPARRAPPAPRSTYDDRDPYLASGNAEAFLRALYLQLALGAATARRCAPTCCCVLVDALRATNRALRCDGRRRLSSLRRMTDRRLPTPPPSHAERPRRRARRRRRPRPRRRDDVHAVRRPRLPDVRRRGQGRPADAAARRAPRADRRVRRRGDRQADPGPRARRAHRRPGVTNGVSAIAQAQFAGSPMVVVGGRAPQNRWGSGSLQELDQPPIFAPVTKLARTIPTAGDVARRHATRRSSPAGSSHRGPVFVDVPMDEFFDTATGAVPDGRRRAAAPSPTPTRVDRDRRAARRGRRRPVLILGTDVWADGAEEAALRFVEALGVPAITNGMGRGVVPGGHPLLVTKARGQALGSADLVVVVGTPLDFRLGLRRLRRQGRRRPRRRSCTSPTPPARSPATPSSPRRSSGDLTSVLDGLAGRARAGRPPARLVGLGRRPAGHRARPPPSATPRCSRAEADPIHPARIYGELVPRLADDAVVIGDGGDFVSFAGKFVEPKRPGGWLDPGPYGCLGAGLGAAIAARIARPSAQVVLLLGDGAAGFSLMDVDTLVRHDLPVVMVMGNNSAWGLEKGPMQMLYGYDVVADLAPRTAYDEVVKALGGGGETVTDPRQIGAGARPGVRLRRALPRQRDHRRRGGLPARHASVI